MHRKQKPRATMRWANRETGQRERQKMFHISFGAEPTVWKENSQLNKNDILKYNIEKKLFIYYILIRMCFCLHVLVQVFVDSNDFTYAFASACSMILVRHSHKNTEKYDFRKENNNNYEQKKKRCRCILSFTLWCALSVRFYDRFHWVLCADCDVSLYL